MASVYTQWVKTGRKMSNSMKIKAVVGFNKQPATTHWLLIVHLKLIYPKTFPLSLLIDLFLLVINRHASTHTELIMMKNAKES